MHDFSPIASLTTSFHLTRTLLVGFICSMLSIAALADPSARVGRIAYLEGDVDFRAGEQADPAQASINWPITGGNRITTAPNARTELRIGSSVIRLDGQSELIVTAIDDDRLALYLPYGSATVRIRNVEVAREFSLQTPQGKVSLLQPGQLRVDAGRNAPTTSVHVIDGAARFDPPQSNQGSQPGLLLAAGARLDSNDGFSQITSLRAPSATDGFDGWSLARDRNDDRSQTVRYVSAETTGYEELERNGVWRTTVDYGPVWTPTVVAIDWAPYRDGRWTWVSPWGWTWVDNAPWGYAPSHYGRWVAIDNRWCWVPGAVVARPVWAPAVVGWQGGGYWNHSNWAARAPTSGWFPLAPQEIYVPSYAVSRTYVERVNINHVTNVTQINNFYRGHADDPSRAGYRYRSMATAVVPAASAPARFTPAPMLPQHFDGRPHAAQTAPAPAALATPVQPIDRGRPDLFRFDGPRDATHRRQSSLQAQQFQAAQSLPPLQPLPQQPQQPQQQPQQLQQPHREQSGFTGRQSMQVQPAPAPAIKAPIQPPAASAQVAVPAPAEHHPHMAGRGHREERITAPPAQAAAPGPAPASAHVPVPGSGNDGRGGVPGGRPPQHEHHNRPEGREPRERREHQPGA